jgi:hypothetical protein
MAQDRMSHLYYIIGVLYKINLYYYISLYCRRSHSQVVHGSAASTSCPPAALLSTHVVFPTPCAPAIASALHPPQKPRRPLPSMAESSICKPRLPQVALPSVSPQSSPQRDRALPSSSPSPQSPPSAPFNQPHAMPPRRPSLQTSSAPREMPTPSVLSPRRHLHGSSILCRSPPASRAPLPRPSPRRRTMTSKGHAASLLHPLRSRPERRRRPSRLPLSGRTPRWPTRAALLLQLCPHYAPPSLPPHHHHPVFASSMHTPDLLQHPRPAPDRLTSARSLSVRRSVASGGHPWCRGIHWIRCGGSMAPTGDDALAPFPPHPPRIMANPHPGLPS